MTYLSTVPTIAIRPDVFEPYSRVRAAHSTRHGGVSGAPYASLNLGKKTDDLSEHIAANRRIFCAELGFEPHQMAWSHQVHGVEVKVVTAPGGAEGYDALITNQTGILLCVSVADCTPILVYDTRNHAAAAIHAGWRGTAGRIIEHTLDLMAARYGTRGADCVASIGPCISARHFEIGPEVAEQIPAEFVLPANRPDKYFADLKAANAAQLIAAGLLWEHIEISPYCTIEHGTDFFSHRREQGLTGRMNGAIGLV
jgi:polyphenol oxidase